MSISTLIRPVLMTSVLWITGPALVQAAEPAKRSDSIAGKAATAKSAVARKPERKKFEGLAVMPAAQSSAESSASSKPAPSAAPALTEKGSHCHSSRSDA